MQTDDNDQSAGGLRRVFDPVRSLFDRYDEGHASGPNKSKVERWKENEIHFPEDHPNDHEASWTSAPGVWYCRSCHEWYRTWDETPKRPKRQEDGW